MRYYERLWRGFWALAATIGVAVGLLVWTVPGGFAALGTLVVLCWLCRHLLADVVPRSRRRSSGLDNLRQASTLAFAILAVCAFGWVSPPLGLFMILTATVTSPALVRRATGSPRALAERAEARDSCVPVPATQPSEAEEVEDVDTQLTLPEAEGPLNGLDARQLCRLWRDSFWLLRDSSSPGVLLCVRLREACLNELESRDASAVQAWLDSGARASSGPEKFLTDPPRGPH